MKTGLAYKTVHEIKVFQEQELQKLLVYLQQQSPFYSKLFDKHKIDIKSIKYIEDLTQLPVTTKDHLQTSNTDFICVPTNKIAEYVTTSGTLGTPITYVLTEGDLERLAYNEATSFNCTGGSADDIYQLVCTMDKRFMAGLAYYLGARKIGAATIRVGAGEPQLQWDSINRFLPTAIVVVPSFLLKMIKYADEHNIDYNKSSVKKAICIGEPIRQQDFTYNTLGEQITQKWDIKLFSTYASTEMSTAFTECEQGVGGHQIPDLIITELLDNNNQPVKPGEPGELTITTLGIEGMPLLRFKTGDICFSYTEPCQCGRHTMRLGPIIGRAQQMIKYKGTTLYPETIFNALNELPDIENYVVEVSSNEIGTDMVLIKLGVVNGSASKEYFIEAIKSRLRVTPEIELHSPKDINKWLFPAMSRKPVKFIDRRLPGLAN